jgi:hypothetical protein
MAFASAIVLAYTRSDSNLIPSPWPVRPQDVLWPRVFGGAMPFTYSFERDPSSFVLLRGIGDVSLVMWSNAMRQVIADRAFRGTMPILLDVTEATGAPPQGDDTLTMARVWHLLTPRSRGGIIASEGRNLRIAQEIEQLSEEHLRAFVDVPSAVQWLHEPVARSAAPSPDDPVRSAPYQTVSAPPLSGARAWTRGDSERKRA